VPGFWIGPSEPAHYCMLGMGHWWSYRWAFVAAEVASVADYVGAVFPMPVVGIGLCFG
jgi:hypothetical protein